MTEGVPTPLKIFVRPERRFVAEGRPTELIVLIRVVPTLPEAQQGALQRNLGFLVDRSQSAEGWLDAVRQGLLGVADVLRPDDRVTLVSAGDFVETLTANSAFGDGTAFRDAVQRLQPAGRSEFFPGWLATARQVASVHDRRMLNRVIVVSDGMTDVGLGGDGPALEAARGLFRRGVSTTTVGLGDGFNDALFTQVAVQGGGNALWVRTPDRLGRRLVAEVRDAERIFSEWATLRFDLDHAEVIDVLNEFAWVGEGKVALPPLYADTPVNVVVRLRLRPGAAGQDSHPLTVRIKSLDLQAKQAVVHRKAMRVHVVSDALADGMAPDMGVQAQAARLEFARTHEKCVRRLEAGDLRGARQLLDFSLSRFQNLSGRSGGSLLTNDIVSMTRLRERVEDPAHMPASRKAFRYAATAAQRGSIHPLEFDA